MKLFGGFHGNRSSSGKKPLPAETEEKAPIIMNKPAPGEEKLPEERTARPPKETPKAPPAEAPKEAPQEAPVPAQEPAEAPPAAEKPAAEPAAPTPPAEEPTQVWDLGGAPDSPAPEEPTQVWAAEETSPAQEPEKKADEASPEGTKEIRFRTPEEEAEIEEIIAAYQKKKRRRRIIILAVLAALVIGGVVLWTSLVKPPEIIQPTGTPRTEPTARPTSEPTATPAPGEATPEPTPVETPPPERMRRENVYTFLMIGRDQGGGNTDTIMAGVFDVNAGTVNVVSIPRDTCANVDSNPKNGETKKISGVYARADYEGLRDAVADMCGFPIDCYVSVGVNGFVQLVETIGGVTFNIPHYMNYDDPTQNLHIHFSPGEQYINGYDAIKVVRWRQNNDGTNYGDIDRINTQQAFLKTVFKKCLSLDNLVTNLDDYIKIFQEYVKSDLTTGNMTWFAKEFLKLNMDNIQFHTMPSNYNDWIGGFSYGTVLVDEWLEMLNEYLNPYDQPITLEDVDLISRDENGELYATSGEIRGGMESFLTMEEYLRQLRQWNEYLESQSSKIEESTGNGGDTNGGE